MTAPLRWAPPERYDASCAYCSDGVPIARFRGKACCGKCAAIIEEGGLAVEKMAGRHVHRRARWIAEPTTEQLRALIRYLLGTKTRQYVPPLYERALLSLRPQSIRPERRIPKKGAP